MPSIRDTFKILPDIRELSQNNLQLTSSDPPLHYVDQVQSHLEQSRVNLARSRPAASAASAAAAAVVSCTTMSNVGQQQQLLPAASILN